MRDSKPFVEPTLNSEKMRQQENCFRFLFLNYMQNLPTALLTVTAQLLNTQSTLTPRLMQITISLLMMPEGNTTLHLQCFLVQCLGI